MEQRNLLQSFEWYLPNDAGHWRRTAEAAAYLAELGFTDIWLPPAYKGNSGIDDVGDAGSDFCRCPRQPVRGSGRPGGRMGRLSRQREKRQRLDSENLKRGRKPSFLADIKLS